jgi:hypothetical protein
MSRELEHRIREVIATVQKVSYERPAIKKRILEVAVRRILDLIKEEINDLGINPKVNE